MSTATAVRALSGDRAQDQYEGFVETPELELNSGESTPTNDRVRKAVHAGFLADEKETSIQTRFSELAEELEERAAGLSATRRAMKFPAFNEILALGDAVLPEVIARLKTSDNRPLWLRVLGTLTPFPPGAGAETVDDAAAAWIRWGRLSS